MASQPEQSVVNNVLMETAMEQELRETLREPRASLPYPLDKVELAIKEVKMKINAATSDSGIAAALPTQFQLDVCEYLKGYHAQVEVLTIARSALTKLQSHVDSKMFPASMNSIKAPSIQFSSVFINAPADAQARGSYNLTPGADSSVFELAVERAVKALKEKVLENWVAEKAKEIRFLEGKALVTSTVKALREVVEKKHVQLKARYDYLVGQPAYDDIISDVNSYTSISHALAMTIITKMNSLVLDKEDKWLMIALKKMSLTKPAEKAALQAQSNELSELKKMVGDLTKKVELQSKKVSDHLYTLLCVCCGHLSLTPPLLETLLVDIVWEGWEEVRWQGQGEEGKDHCHHRKKGQKSQCHLGHSEECEQGQERQRQGWRTCPEVKGAGQQEEEWQVVGTALGLDFRTDSVSTGSVFWSGLYDFLQLYGLDWGLLMGLFRFLCMSFSPSILLHVRLVLLIQLCSVMFCILHAD